MNTWKERATNRRMFRQAKEMGLPTTYPKSRKGDKPFHLERKLRDDVEPCWLFGRDRGWHKDSSYRTLKAAQEALKAHNKKRRTGAWESRFDYRIAAEGLLY